MKVSTSRALAFACATTALPLVAVSANASPQQVPESLWLTGNSLGSQGTWGTTYPVNLRLYMADLSADEWVRRARTLKTRPPMPWFVLREFEEADLRALHAFIRSLGPAGTPAPAYRAPGLAAAGPVIVFPAPGPKGEP